MVPEDHALRQFFHEVVGECYSEYLRMEDNEIAAYVADLLTDFCSADRLYPIRDAEGRRLRDVGEMLLASDPVNGTAASFDVERRIRKHIGDYALFCTGMYPEAVHKWRENESANLYEMIRTGKESYYIVSQFDLFEYAEEAPLFGRLSENFESCMYGLNYVREELERRLPGRPNPGQKFLM
ncbi:MAG: hypothetical protein IRZ03_03320 [Acidobacterium ailaaui]|jgi:hypothetical protein|nr:hypothetical protein [Pseudacidobacterium ailaaui]MCL6463044.1 hypothetical protein [Pseudacidobacterium ailaaui]MDI3253264.1 hypothetical protein [Bacillota bacterium]